jgi:hypothetical protein
VPCCARCNNVRLSQLEKRVQNLLFERPISAARRDLKDIYIWANKILLGIVYAERLLPAGTQRVGLYLQGGEVRERTGFQIELCRKARYDRKRGPSTQGSLRHATVAPNLIDAPVDNDHLPVEIGESAETEIPVIQNGPHTHGSSGDTSDKRTRR